MQEAKQAKKDARKEARKEAEPKKTEEARIDMLDLRWDTVICDGHNMPWHLIGRPGW